MHGTDAGGIGAERVHIEISTRHGTLTAEHQGYLREKAEKLTHYFDRLMQIEVHAEHVKHGWQVEILATAEHKHDFVAKEEGPTPEKAMDACIHKVEQQVRRYKERVQHHHGAVPQGGTSATLPPLPEPPDAS